MQHQGRHFTEGAIRESGLWIVRDKWCISSIIEKCVTCQKLRGKVKEQQMVDLPLERLQMDPPFSYDGLDVFSLWKVVTRCTRGGRQVNSNRWAVLFTCMCTRAVHFEVIEEMSSSSFINALRRFFAIRGPSRHCGLIMAPTLLKHVGSLGWMSLNSPKCRRIYKIRDAHGFSIHRIPPICVVYGST